MSSAQLGFLLRGLQDDRCEAGDGKAGYNASLAQRKPIPVA